MVSVSYETDILRCVVNILFIQDGAFKYVVEFLSGVEEVWAYKVYYILVFNKVVLQGVFGQYYSTARANVFQGLRGVGLVVFDAVFFVIDYYIRVRAV